MYRLFIIMTMGITLFGMLIVPAFSSPVNQNVILQYGDTIEEKHAVDELKRLNPNSAIVSAQSMTRGLALQRSFGNALFVVGHGSAQGIMHQNKLIPWTTVNKLVATSGNQNVFYISCNSEVAAQDLKANSKKNAFGFPTIIDATFGAQLVSFISTNI